MVSSPSKKGTSAKKAASGSSKSSLHPTYNEMIQKAIVALKERNGASRQKVASYIVSNYTGLGEPSSVTAPLRRALVKALAAGTIINTKGTGASGRFKLANVPKPAAVKKSPAKQKAVAAKPKASTAAKKTTTAKAATKKSPAKRKPKSKAVKKTKTAKSPKKVKPVAKGKSAASKTKKATKSPAKKVSKAAASKK